MFWFICFAFFIGFVIEAMVGLGGTLIAYAFLLFFIPAKPLIVSTIILPIIASFVIIIMGGYKNINIKALLIYTPICLVAVPIGIFLFEYLPNGVVLKILASFLILFGIRNIFFGELFISGLIGKIIVFISGIVHGLVGTGGPVAAIGMRRAFGSKASFRASLAVFFIVLNIFRLVQLSFTYEVRSFVVNIAACIPMILGIALGDFLHKKISEKLFTKLLSVFFILAGILLFLR